MAGGLLTSEPVRAETRWVRWLGWSAVALVALLIAAMYAFWGAWRAMQGGAGPQTAPTPIAVAVPAGRADAPASSASSGALVVAEPAVPEGSIAVCGGNPISVANNTVDQLEFLLNGQTRSMRKAVAGLVASDQPRLRAAGLVLADVQAETEAARLVPLQNKDCRNDLACGERRFTEWQRQSRRASVPHLEALARLALQQDDVAVYGLAAQMCRGRAADAPACGLVSVARWAQLEPDNMAVWLYLADEAAQRKDAAAVAEAYHRAGLATAQRHHENLLFDAVRSRATEAPSSVSELMLYLEAVGAWSGRLMPSMQGPLAHCSGDVDANRRQSCDGLAQALIERGNSFVDVVVGLGIASKGSWPADKLAALNDQKHAAQILMGRRLPPNDPLSCKTLQATRAYFQEVSELGEWGAARATLQRSGMDAKVLADEQRLALADMAAAHHAALAAAASAAGTGGASASSAAK